MITKIRLFLLKRTLVRLENELARLKEFERAKSGTEYRGAATELGFRIRYDKEQVERRIVCLEAGISESVAIP